MTRLRYFKYGAGVASSGLVAAYFTNTRILTESDEDSSSSETAYEKKFKTFRDSFNWSKIGDEIQEKKKLENIIIDSIELRDNYLAPKYPIILCHGLSGFDRLVLVPSLNQMANFLKGKSFIKNQEPDDVSLLVEDKGGISLDYWFGIQEALELRGSTVLVAKVSSFGSIQNRADELNKFITSSVSRLERLPKYKVYNDYNESNNSFENKGEKMKINLIAHSMGGLDCRWLISEMEKKNYEVVSLTTVTTPHRGSEVADYVVDLATNLPEAIRLPPSIYQLTTDYLKKFNQVVKNDPNVTYLSYGACFVPKWYNTFFTTWNIINNIAGPNDGMVSVKSAKWGTYLGTLTDLDHLDLINWTSALKRSSKVITRPLNNDNKDGINTVALYLDIADNLARRGL